jgi:hypothetical protein
MGSPVSAVIFDAEGRVAMIIHPDNEKQLDDPAFNPKGHVHVRVARAVYDKQPAPINLDGLAHYHELTKALLPELTKVDSAVALKAQAAIDAVDAQLAEAAATAVADAPAVTVDTP